MGSGRSSPSAPHPQCFLCGHKFIHHFLSEQAPPEQVLSTLYIVQGVLIWSFQEPVISREWVFLPRASLEMGGFKVCHLHSPQPQVYPGKSFLRALFLTFTVVKSLEKLHTTEQYKQLQFQYNGPTDNKPHSIRLNLIELN